MAAWAGGVDLGGDALARRLHASRLFGDGVGPSVALIRARDLDSGKAGVFAAATAALAWTGGWRASFSRLAYTRHALESASVGFACLLLPKLGAALVA